MRICLFGTRMDLASGHSRPAFELASGLMDRGHDVRILSTALHPASRARHAESLARSPHLGRVPVDRPFAGLREILQDWRRSREVLRGLLVDCDLVHGFSLYATSILNMLAPVRIPHILSLNTDFRPPVRDYLTMLAHAPFYFRQLRYSAGLSIPTLLLKHSFFRFERIICWTSYLHEKLLSLGIPVERLARIPVGIDMARFDLRARRDSEGSPLFLYSGALSSLRGIRVLMRAFRIVKGVEAGARLVIADRGPHTINDVPMHAREERRLLQQIAEYGLRDSVVRTESGGDLSAWTNACDAVVLPFNTTIGYSQPPLTLLEAMAHARPVISTRLGSIPEYIQDGVSGLLVEPGDADGLARAMLELTPEAGRTMGRNAGLQIEANHNWEPIVKKTESIYLETLQLH